MPENYPGNDNYAHQIKWPQKFVKGLNELLSFKLGYSNSQKNSNNLSTKNNKNRKIKWKNIRPLLCHIYVRLKDRIYNQPDDSYRLTEKQAARVESTASTAPKARSINLFHLLVNIYQTTEKNCLSILALPGATHQDPTQNEIINDLNSLKTKYIIISNNLNQKKKPKYNRNVSLTVVNWLKNKMCRLANDSYQLPENYIKRRTTSFKLELMNWPCKNGKGQMKDGLTKPYLFVIFSKQCQRLNRVHWPCKNGKGQTKDGLTKQFQTFPRSNNKQTSTPAFPSRQTALERAALTADIEFDSYHKQTSTPAFSPRQAARARQVNDCCSTQKSTGARSFPYCKFREVERQLTNKLVRQIFLLDKLHGPNYKLIRQLFLLNKLHGPNNKLVRQLFHKLRSS